MTKILVCMPAVLLQCTPPNEFAWDFQKYLGQWFCTILKAAVFSCLERKVTTYACLYNLYYNLYCSIFCEDWYSNHQNGKKSN